MPGERVSGFPYVTKKVEFSENKYKILSYALFSLGSAIQPMIFKNI